MDFDTQPYLVGSGHFAFGFIIGYVWMKVQQTARQESLNAQLYLPFVPICAGIWAAMPYIFFPSSVELPFWLNIFFLYQWAHHDQLLIILLGRPNWVVLICGGLYVLILLRYIRLCHYCRRHGWPNANQGEPNAG